MALDDNRNADCWNADLKGELKESHGLERYSSTPSLSRRSVQRGGSWEGNRSSPIHNTSHLRLLAWVVFTRDSQPWLSDTQRCTCPMSGCELQFQTSKAMHLHLRTSTCLSKKFYNCVETREKVRIGKCVSDGCSELKGRLTSAMKSITRRLSGRHSKSMEASKSCLEEILPSHDSLQGNINRSVDIDGLIPATTASPYEIDSQPTPCEMDSRPAPSELYSTMSPYSFTANLLQADGQDKLHFHDVAAATCVQQSTTEWLADRPFIETNDIQQISPELQASSSDRVHEFSGELASAEPCPGLDHVHTGSVQPSTGHFLRIIDQCQVMDGPLFPPHNIDKLRDPYIGKVNLENIGKSLPYGNQELYSAKQVVAQNDSEYQHSDKIVVDDYQATHHPWKHPRVIPYAQQHNARMDSADSDSSFASSMFSNPSMTTNRQSSYGSFSSTPANLEYTPFFLDGRSEIFEEPARMEGVPTSVPYDQEFTWSPANLKAPRCDTAGVSFDDYVSSGRGHSNFTLNHHQMPASVQSVEESATLEVSSKTQPALAQEACRAHVRSLSASQVSTASLPSRPRPSRKAPCSFCHTTCDMSNRRRHEKFCKKNPASAKLPRIKCHFPDCESTFSRRDNLAHHQMVQNHGVVGNVEVKISLTPSPGSPVWELAMQMAMQASERDHGQDMASTSG